MSAYPEAENCSHEDMKGILQRIKLLLDNFPNQLPEKPAKESKFSDFIGNFTLDPDLLEKTGSEVSALSEHLKTVFGWDARTRGDGIVPFLERGVAVRALQPVLANFLTRHPEDNVLKKWIIDVLKGAENVYLKLDLPVPTVGPQKRPRSESANLILSEKAGKATKCNAKMTPTRAASVSSIERNTSASGRKPDSLLNRLANKLVFDDGKAGWECIAPGCNHRQKGNLQGNRILKHACTCTVLQEHNVILYDEACRQAGNQSLGSQLDGMDADGSGRMEPGSATELLMCSKESGTQMLRMEPLIEAGKKSKAERTQQFQAQVDHIIMRLICVRGLVPNILDSPEWKELMNKLNPTYKPSSANHFREVFIPQEAVHVREKQIALLKQEENLTLTFDGTSIRKQESFYSAHVTTPSRTSFFLDGYEGSGEHHDTEWIKTRLLKTINSIGPGKWAAIVSDSTNVTKAARREINRGIPTMLDLRDCVHHLQNTIKDITHLDVFKPFIRNMKSIIQHFSKSSFSTTKLREARNIAGEDKPVKALQKIGKTRFGTYWLAATALEPCLPQIRDLVTTNVIKFKNTHVQSMFTNRHGGKYQEFEKQLLWYISIVAPLIRSLWSLEAAHANASDVFVFWLAAAATLNDFISKGESATGIPRSVGNKITEIYNKRYGEFFGNDFYFAAFLLDPRYNHKEFLKKSQISLFIPPEAARHAGRSADVVVQEESPRDVLLKFLRAMLRGLLERIEQNPDDNGHQLLRKKGFGTCVQDLSAQLRCFWDGGYPFIPIQDSDRHLIDNPLEWWEDVARIKKADVLAFLSIRIFSILVNSMPDERTNSTITWLNSPVRGNQQSRSIINMIQVGQWYRKHANDKPKLELLRSRPAVRFRVIDKDVLERIQTQSDEERRLRAMQRELQEAGPQILDDGPTTEDGGESDSDDDENVATGITDPVQDCISMLLVGFKVNPYIDLKSAVLRDMIAEEPIVQAQTTIRNLENVSESYSESITVDQAFAKW